MQKAFTRAAWLLCAAFPAMAVGQSSNGVHALTTFTNGMDDWGVLFQGFPPDLGDHRVDVGGSHGMVFRFVDLMFSVDFRNERNADFLGDYTRLGAPLRFSFDERNAANEFLATPTIRNYHLQFLKHVGNDHIGVSYALDPVYPVQGWVTHSVLFNPDSKHVPQGWVGFDQYGSTTLPPGYTFSDVMRDVDMVRITNAAPGYANHDAWFAVMFDNITLQSVAVHQGDAVETE